MKKMFKLLTVAFVALTTFISAGCSCSLSDKKAAARAEELNDSNLYSASGKNQDFKLTYTEYNYDNGDVYVTVYDTLLDHNQYTVINYTNDEETARNTYSTNLLGSDSIISTYDLFKKQPNLVYNEKISDYDVLRQLYGLSAKTDHFLGLVEVDRAATKTLFGKKATFVIEYTKELGSIEKYRETISINKQNKITGVLVELVGNYATNKYGDREEKIYTLIEIKIEYK